jgi:hypothetical protein
MFYWLSNNYQNEQGEGLEWEALWRWRLEREGVKGLFFVYAESEKHLY